jgi:hypothetical protein
MKTVVIQSFRTDAVPAWIEVCMASVRNWCELKEYTWRFVGEELFDDVPHWYLEKTGRGPVAADYARLKLLQNALDNDGFDQAIWLDADVYIMAPALSLDCKQSCAFGQETWIQANNNGKGGMQARTNVHNAVCVFRRGCVVLPFLADTVASIIRRADPAHIAPQMVGPKLLTALHSLYGFDLLPQVGALSPAVVKDIIHGGGPALDLLLEKTPVSLQAVNLCASLIDDQSAEMVLERIAVLGI